MGEEAGVRAGMRHLGAQLMGDANLGMLWLEQGSLGFPGRRAWVWMVGPCQEIFVASRDSLGVDELHFSCMHVLFTHACMCVHICLSVCEGQEDNLGCHSFCCFCLF